MSTVIELTPAQIERDEKTADLVNRLTNHVNSFSSKDESFLSQMSMQHRTLQQSFTRLALQWIEHVARDEYRTDARNQASHDICQGIVEEFIASHEGSKPSQYLPFI